MAGGKPGRPKKKNPVGRPKKLPVSQNQADGPTQEVYICSCCGSRYKNQKNNFPHSESPLFASNGHYMTICRKCIDKMYDDYLKQFDGDVPTALRRMCIKLDIYYSPSIVSMARKTPSDRSTVMGYISKANLVMYHGKNYDNTLNEEIAVAISDQKSLEQYNAKAVAPPPLEEEEKEEVTGLKYVVTKEDIVNWGYGFAADDYAWLNDAYDELSATNVIDTTIRNELVRDYCKQKLLASKAIGNGRNDQYIKFSEAAQKTLDKANLTPKIEDATDKAGEKPMGVMIRMFEKERPIPEPRPEWRDVDGIIKFVTVYFIGHLCAMLGLKNKYAGLYEEEMDRYRAILPEYENSSDDDIFDALIDGGIKPLENTPEGRGDV